MRMRAPLATLMAVAIASPGMAAVDVRVSGQSVDVQASNAPLSEVLDRLSRQTQMKIVYDGTPPRQTVTLDLRGRTPVEAVVAALEGQGVNYALAMDPTGTRVETLLVSGTATASARTGPEPRRSPVITDMPAEPVVDEPEAVVEDEGQPPADTSAGLNLPGPQGKEAQPEQAPPPEANVGFSASPFAPSARPPQPTPPQPQQQPPQPQATPPPFNP
jgi:hypothetical protein